MTRKSLLFIISMLTGAAGFGQRGKNGNVTISASAIVNEFTYLTANAAVGATSITVNSNNLNANGRFSTALAAGDLIMIIQMQGATMNATQSFQWSLPNDNTWGGVTAYNNAGNYEFREVASVAGGGIINLTCGLSNAYTATGHVQVVRVPRYLSLTVNSIITTENWNGQTGGIVAIEVDGTTTINAAGNIDASSTGFRGGDVTGDNTTVFGGTAWGSSDNAEGAPKGEGIAGFTTEYGPLSATYCRGAPTNGGGGGDGHNSGGGGGSNAGDISNYNGYGNPNATTGPWTNAWNQEAPGFATNTSSGGGRGGYTHSSSNQNATILGPGQGAWSADLNRNVGGQGGWPLDYSTGKLFIGGGGGAGEQNENDGGDGGRGGGMVYIMAYGDVTGSGFINANGQNGFACDNSGGNIFTAAGLDGAGGAGGGGTIVVKVDGTVSNTLTLNANGGTGGNNNFAGPGTYNSAYGPGGGGGGGYISVTAGTPTRNANGGNNGTSNSSAFTEWIHKGATRGGAGTNNATTTAYDITVANQTICSGTSATLTATITGTSPGGTLYWFTTQFGPAFAASGTTFITPGLVANTTYYVGFCPGSFRVPVTVTISPPITINTAGVIIADETCAGNDGSITGITASGGTGTLNYDWNGTSFPGPTISGVVAGSYTLTVSDAAGCSASAGPFTINNGGGPIINTAGIVLTGTTCNQNNGSITGITATGTGTMVFSWNGNNTIGADTLNLGAGSYTLTVSDGSGCNSTAGPFAINNSGGVTLDTTTHTITNATCGGSNGSVTGILVTASTGGLSFEWNGIPSASIDLTGVPAGNYVLEVTDGSGCAEITGLYVIGSNGGATINNTSVNVSSTTCALVNGSITGITATGTAPLTYSWNGNNTVTADTVNLGAGSYTLTVTDGFGCIVTDGPYVINPSNTITVSATGNDATCNGYTDGDATASFTGGNGGEVFQWISGPATANNPNLGAGTYTVTVTDATGCDDTTTVTISEPAPVVASITGTTTVCAGSPTTLTASGGGTYLWDTPAATAAITVSPTVNTTYQCIVSVGVCSDTATITVNILPLPVASATGTPSVCVNQPASLSASGGISYVWNTGDTTSSIIVSPATPTTYTVTATNSCGSDTATVTVGINTSPTVGAQSDQTIVLGGNANLLATGATSYVWSPASGLGCFVCTSTTASPVVTTTYMVIGTDANGCTDTAYVTITVDANVSVFVPDIFSPDGNGANDVLFVRGSGIDEMLFRVYDRWGQKVFESSTQTEGWDGTMAGKQLNAAVFIYTLDGTFSTGETFSRKGNVTLQR